MIIRLQTSDRITTYPYGTNLFKLCESEMLSKILNAGKVYMIKFDGIVNENKTVNSKNWPNIPDHPYIILIIGGSGSRKTNALLDLINNQPGIDKIFARKRSI